MFINPMFGDPVYWVVMGVGFLLSLWASARTKGVFHEYSQKPTRSGMTGAQIAEAILRTNGIHDVTVERVAGSLTDHYDPTTKTLRLSDKVYGERSMAAFGVAAHEVGHAIQHATGYAALKFRSAWVPIASIGTNFGMILVMFAAFAGGFATNPTMSTIGLLLFAASTVFTLITLPVEFDASRRALVSLQAGGFTTSQELDGARRVLNAAALTYVAAFVSSLLMLLYWAARLGLFGHRSNNE